MIGPGFRLGEARAAERTARDRLTFEAWGERLTREQYLERERLLRQTAHGRLSMHSWVLRLQNGVIAASCETFRLPLLPAGAVEVVASVYVDRPLRGVRMASRLMEALVASRQEAGLDALVLFTEVGAGLYERAGFRLLPAPTRRWAARAAPDGAPGVERLGPAQLGDALALRQRLRDGRIDLRLTEPVVSWHLERARFYARTMGRAPPQSVGARHGDVVALWAPDFKCDVLRILEASGPAGADLEPVARAAAAEAQSLGLRTAELWDDSHSLLLAGGTPADRDDDLPMGRSFTPRGELFLGPLSRACWA